MARDETKMVKGSEGLEKMQRNKSEKKKNWKKQASKQKGVVWCDKRVQRRRQASKDGRQGKEWANVSEVCSRWCDKVDAFACNERKCMIVRGRREYEEKGRGRRREKREERKLERREV